MHHGCSSTGPAGSRINSVVDSIHFVQSNSVHLGLIFLGINTDSSDRAHGLLVIECKQLFNFFFILIRSFKFCLFLKKCSADTPLDLLVVEYNHFFSSFYSINLI